MTNTIEPKRWAAISYPCEGCGIDKMTSKYGSTPEIAVANLWLELNKKK